MTSKYVFRRTCIFSLSKRLLTKHIMTFMIRTVRSKYEGCDRLQCGSYFDLRSEVLIPRELLLSVLEYFDY